MRLLLATFLMVLSGFSAVASAKSASIPTSNRLLCPSINSLERAIKILPSASAIRSASTVPDAAGLPDKKTGAPGCIWLGGKLPITIVDTIGWLYSGNYLFLVHGIGTGDGRKWLHASKVVSRQDWRLPSECSQINPFVNVKAALPTGEEYRFFGFKKKTGFDESCLALVNLQNEADVRNAPRKSFSDVWKSKPHFRNSVVCTRLDGLTTALDRMVNEQQVNNNDIATFRARDQCLSRSIDEIVASRYLGRYLTQPQDPEGKRFFVQLHEVIYINTKTGILTPLFMPTNAIRQKLMRLSGPCGTETQIPNKGRREITLYGTEIVSVKSTTIETPLGDRTLPALTNSPVGDSTCDTDRNVYSSGR